MKTLLQTIDEYAAARFQHGFESRGWFNERDREATGQVVDQTGRALNTNIATLKALQWRAKRYDGAMNAVERVPTGDDYNNLYCDVMNVLERLLGEPHETVPTRG